MKSKQQNTGTGVTVFAILALTFCLSGTAGSKSERSIITFDHRPAVHDRKVAVAESASAKRKTRKEISKRRISRKKRIAAMAYLWYVLANKNPT